MANNRKFVKLLDIEYHRRSRGFTFNIKNALPLHQLTVVTNDSGNKICRYLTMPGEAPRVVPYGFTPLEIDEILEFFEKTWEITDYEWGLFTMVRPDLCAKIGKITLDFCYLEIYLEGRYEGKIGIYH